MEAQPVPLQVPAPAQAQFEPNMEKIKQKLLKHGVFPTPKILRTIRKKEIQKHNRKQAKMQSQAPLTPSQQQALAEEQDFQTLKREFKQFRRAVASKSCDPLLGKPWERIERLKFRQLASQSKEFAGDNLKRENLRELKEMFEKDLNWILDDDVQVGSHDLAEKVEWEPEKRWRSEAEAIRVLVDRFGVLILI